MMRKERAERYRKRSERRVAEISMAPASAPVFDTQIGVLVELCADWVGSRGSEAEYQFVGEPQ